MSNFNKDNNEQLQAIKEAREEKLRSFKLDYSESMSSSSYNDDNEISSFDEDNEITSNSG